MIYNHTIKKWVEKQSTNTIYGIVHIDQNYIENGYFNISYSCIPILIDGNVKYLYSKDSCKLPLYWSNTMGCYVLDISQANNIISPSKFVFNYPIPESYNFSKLHLCEKEVKCDLDPMFKYINNFTIGLEYETSGGNIPWLDCINTNLIPLYDGSITGHEYVTFPLKAENFSLIKTHLHLLKNYTRTDHNCSLHIHIGGFPINYEKIESLCKYWFYFQKILFKYIPVYSYYTEKYKDNGKAYNKPWHYIDDLSEFYESYTDNVYVNDNDFFLPNGYDVKEEKKWNVVGRYYNMNIMHLISGKEHKTVEFRFLRPTTNYSEIKWYVLILSAFLRYVMDVNGLDYKSITLDKVLKNTFPTTFVDMLKQVSKKLCTLHKIQITNNDKAGINDKLKLIYFDISKFYL